MDTTKNIFRTESEEDERLSWQRPEVQRLQVTFDTRNDVESAGDAEGREDVVEPPK